MDFSRHAPLTSRYRRREQRLIPVPSRWTASDLERSAGSVTFMGDQDGQVRDVETGKAEKGAGRSSWQKGEFAPAPDRAAQYTCFFARIL